MNPKRITSPLFWIDLLTEIYWESFTCPVDRQVVGLIQPTDYENVAIRWPKNYSWPKCSKWLEPLKQGFKELVPLSLDAKLESNEGAVLIEVDKGNKTYLVAIDYSDYPKLNTDFAERTSLYFKMQFASYGYNYPQVVPGGFLPNDMAIYSYLSHLWKIKAKAKPSYDVYGRFGASFATQIRTNALEKMHKQRRFGFEGSLKITRYSKFLREVAKSKVCLNLPGNGDLCFRLFDYLAVGACVVSPPLTTILPVPLEDRKHVAFVQADLSDLVDVCEYYLAHEKERLELQRNAREYFLRHIHYKALGHYYLKQCLSKLE